MCDMFNDFICYICYHIFFENLFIVICKLMNIFMFSENFWLNNFEKSEFQFTVYDFFFNFYMACANFYVNFLFICFYVFSIFMCFCLIFYMCLCLFLKIMWILFVFVCKETFVLIDILDRYVDRYVNSILWIDFLNETLNVKFENCKNMWLN